MDQFSAVVDAVLITRIKPFINPSLYKVMLTAVVSAKYSMRTYIHMWPSRGHTTCRSCPWNTTHTYMYNHNMLCFKIFLCVGAATNKITLYTHLFRWPLYLLPWRWESPYLSLSCLLCQASSKQSMQWRKLQTDKGENSNTNTYTHTHTTFQCSCNRPLTDLYTYMCV